MKNNDERPSAEDQRLADFIRNEGGQIAHDMAHHLGDQLFEVMKRNGLAMKSEAGATAMLTIAATMMLEQAIDQCSRAAEEDCRAAVLRLFRDLLNDKTKAVLNELAIDLSDVPETVDFTGAVVGKYAPKACSEDTSHDQ